MRPTERFSSRVDNYIKYRPGYPHAIIDCLSANGVLSPTSVVADVGSGTGLLTRLFLENGNRVIGVEPNREMRVAGEKELAASVGFTSVDGTAEATGLSDQSVDLVAAGQAFHWFDREKAAAEFSRILREPGWIVLMWNERLTVVAPFLAAYERLLKEYCTDYGAVDHRNMTGERIAAFYAPSAFSRHAFPNHQTFDFDGLRGRLLSSSYAPEPVNARHDAMLAELAAIFQAHQSNGQVVIEYETNVYVGAKRPR